MDYHGSLGLLVLCVASIHSFEYDNDGLKLSPNFEIEQNEPVASDITLKEDQYTEPKKGTRDNVKNVPSINTNTVQELAYVTKTLEDLLREVLLPKPRGYISQDPKDDISNRIWNSQPVNTATENSIDSLRKHLEQLALSNKLKQFYANVQAQPQEAVNIPPTESVATDTSQVVTNFTEGVPQITVSPAELHLLLKNMHVLDKRQVGHPQQPLQILRPALLSKRDSTNFNPYPFVVMSDFNPDPAIIKYIVSPAIQHALLHSHMPSEFHLVPPHYHRMAKTRSDDDKCTPGTRWTVYCDDCTCNEAGEANCVENPNCVFKEIMTNCKPLTTFALDLCTECLCGKSNVPRCYSKCGVEQTEESNGQNIGVVGGEAT